MITRNEVDQLFEYRDGDLYWRTNPSPKSAVDISKPAGTIKTKDYRYIVYKGKRHAAHRLIYLLHNPGWDITDISKTNTIDHRDNDKHNNNIDNLRIATAGEQKHNAVLMRNNTSGHKGVSWNKACGKWRVRVMMDGTYQYGGHFTDLDKAAAKAAEMREMLHGEYVNHG
jgi:hypothetical protein